MASRRQTYGYLPSRMTSLPCDWYQILLSNRAGMLCCGVCLMPSIGSRRFPLPDRDGDGRDDGHFRIAYASIRRSYVIAYVGIVR